MKTLQQLLTVFLLVFLVGCATGQRDTSPRLWQETCKVPTFGFSHSLGGGVLSLDPTFKCTTQYGPMGLPLKLEYRHKRGATGSPLFMPLELPCQITLDD